MLLIRLFLIAIIINAAVVVAGCAKLTENTPPNSIDTGAELKPGVSNTIADLTLYIVDNVRPLDVVVRATKQMRSFFEESCNLTIKTFISPLRTQNNLNTESVPLTSARLRTLTEDTVQEKQETLRLFFIHSTLENDTAFAYLPSANVVESGTAWVTRLVSTDCLPVIMAHEVGHLLLDDASHNSQLGNIMYHGCTSTNFGNGYKLRKFSPDQCRKMQEQLLLRPNG